MVDERSGEILQLPLQTVIVVGPLEKGLSIKNGRL